MGVHTEDTFLWSEECCRCAKGQRLEASNFYAVIILHDTDWLNVHII